MLPRPEYIIYGTRKDEIQAVLDFIRECREGDIAYGDIAIAAMKKDELKEMQSLLHVANLPYKDLENGDTGDKSGVVLSTMHNMKGLEFKVVIIIGINQNSFPSKPYNWAEMNKKEPTNHLMNQRSLLYVAITRAMQMVRITGVGEKSEML